MIIYVKLSVSPVVTNVLKDKTFLSALPIILVEILQVGKAALWLIN